MSRPTAHVPTCYMRDDAQLPAAVEVGPGRGELGTPEGSNHMTHSVTPPPFHDVYDRALTLSLAEADLALVRKCVRSTLLDWYLPADLRDDVELVVAELATNAQKHCPTRLTIARRDQRVLVAVADSSTVALPVVAGAEADEAGRGLFIVCHLSESHGCAVGSAHKVVWAVVGGERAQGDGESALGQQCHGWSAAKVQTSLAPPSLSMAA